MSERKTLADVFGEPDPDATPVREYPKAPAGPNGVVRVPRELIEAMKVAKPDRQSVTKFHADLLATALWTNPEARKYLESHGWGRERSAPRPIA